MTATRSATSSTQSVDEFEETTELQPGYHRWMMTHRQGDGRASPYGRRRVVRGCVRAGSNAASRRAPYDWRVLREPRRRRTTCGLTIREADDANARSLCRALDDYERARRVPTHGRTGLDGRRQDARAPRPPGRGAIEALKKAAKFDKRTKRPETLLDEVDKLRKREETAAGRRLSVVA